MLGNTDMRVQGEEIRNIVRRVLLRTLGMSEISEPQTPLSPSATKRPLITEEDVEALPSGGELHFPAEAIVTPRARELALERRISLCPEPVPVRTSSSNESPPLEAESWWPWVLTTGASP